MGVVAGVGVGRVLNAVAAGLGLHHNLAFAHLALPVEDRDQGLVGRAAYHFGTIGEAFDDPQQVLGRLLPRALWGRWGATHVPGCQKVGDPLPLGTVRRKTIKAMWVGFNSMRRHGAWFKNGRFRVALGISARTLIGPARWSGFT